MPKEFKPHPYQKFIIDHIIDNKRCAVWAGMGMGKTSSTLTAVSDLMLVSDKPTLVLAPKRVAQSTWPEERDKWNHTCDLRMSVICGNVRERELAIKAKADIWTTNYEQLPWLVDYYGSKWPFQRIIADESTKLKSFRIKQGGLRSGLLAKVAYEQCDEFVELTGTPSPNGLQDLWGQMYFIDRGQRLGRTYSAFQDRWFRTKRNGHGIEPLPYAQKEIQELLKDICMTVEAKDWFDLREPIVRNIYVDLPARARKAYEEMEKKMYTELDTGHAIEAVNAASKTMKCLQLANGALYVEGKSDEWVDMHDLKLQALDEIIEEAAGMPVLVAYHFKSDLARLKKAFPKGRHLDANPQTIRDWNAGKIPVLFAHPGSAGHGLNLQDGGNILVYFGHWWNLEERLQILERIGPTRQLQAGHDRVVFVYNIVARDTVDELVLESSDTKREVQDILMAAMSRRKAKK